MDLALLDICIYVNTVECGNRVCAGWAQVAPGIILIGFSTKYLNAYVIRNEEGRGY